MTSGTYAPSIMPEIDTMDRISLEAKLHQSVHTLQSICSRYLVSIGPKLSKMSQTFQFYKVRGSINWDSKRVLQQQKSKKTQHLRRKDSTSLLLMSRFSRLSR